MLTTRTVPARPVLLIAPTSALLLTPNGATADPEPPTRERAQDQGPARAPESAARRSLMVNSGPVTAGVPDHGFGYAPVWFTDLGPGVRVEQSYATGNPLVSGHWRTLSDGSGGPAAAAGRASVVSAPRAVLFGTEPLFRDPPKGEFAQVGRALFTMAHASSG